MIWQVSVRSLDYLLCPCSIAESVSVSNVSDCVKSTGLSSESTGLHKEHELKWSECVKSGAQANVEMQLAARKVTLTTGSFDQFRLPRSFYLQASLSEYRYRFIVLL